MSSTAASSASTIMAGYLDRVYDQNMKESEAAYAAHLKASKELHQAQVAMMLSQRAASALRSELTMQTQLRPLRLRLWTGSARRPMRPLRTLTRVLESRAIAMAVRLLTSTPRPPRSTSRKTHTAAKRPATIRSRRTMFRRNHAHRPCTTSTRPRGTAASQASQSTAQMR